MNAAIVGKNGILWNAKAIIDHDDIDHVRQLARVLLEQRNEMYAMLEMSANILSGDDYKNEVSTDDIRALLAKARGE